MDNWTVGKLGCLRKNMSFTWFVSFYNGRVVIVCSFRYSHPDQMILFTDPISGNRVSFPPCLVTPATSNQEFAKGSIMDRRLLSQRAPVTACFEGLLLDSLLLFDDRSATVDDLYSSLKLNPFINTSEDVSLSSV